MLKALKELLGSKKAIMAILSGVGWLVGKLGFDLNSEELAGALAPLLVYIGAQGYADHGKSKALVEGATEVEVEKVRAESQGG